MFRAPGSGFRVLRISLSLQYYQGFQSFTYRFMANNEVSFTDMKAIIIIFIILSILQLPCNSQESPIDKIDLSHKKCLESKTKPYVCSRRYFQHLDSLLNNLYNSLKAGMDSADRAVLRKDQANWLIERNRKFKKIEVEIQQFGFTGPETEVTKIDEKAKVLRARVIYLSNYETPVKK